MIHKKYSLRHRGFLIEGLKEMSWDDCLATIDFQDEKTCAISLGGRYLAVAVSQGTIYLYYQDSIQLKHTLAFGDWANVLLLSIDCGYLAAGGTEKTVVWDTESGTQLWAFDLKHAALSATFDTEMDTLFIATEGGYTVTFDVREGTAIERWKWSESVNPSKTVPKPYWCPSMVLSPQKYLL